MVCIKPLLCHCVSHSLTSSGGMKCTPPLYRSGHRSLLKRDTESRGCAGAYIQRARLNPSMFSGTRVGIGLGTGIESLMSQYSVCTCFEYPGHVSRIVKVSIVSTKVDDTLFAGEGRVRKCSGSYQNGLTFFPCSVHLLG